LKTEETSQDTTPLRCSAVVTTWKRPVLLRDTLCSLLQQTYEDLEVLVVCDGEDADVRSIAEEFEKQYSIRWIFHEANRGLPAARNTGAREAHGDIVLFLDDDVEADRELVATHMRHHQTADKIRKLAVCSLTEEDRHSPLSSYVNLCLDEAWKKMLDSFAATLQATEVDSIGEEVESKMWFGLNCSIHRDLFLSHGGFNEEFRASDEEMELGLRLYLAGVEFVFEPRRLLTHRNSKELDHYFCNAWGASGALDVFRVFKLGQRNTQTQHLVSMFHGHLLNRVVARCAWHLSESLRGIASGLKTAANRMRWRFLFGAWSRISQAAEYWSRVRATGCTLAQLKSVVGPSKHALMLHSVCEARTKEEATYYVAPRRFHGLMRSFHAKGYRTATLAEWLKDDIPENHVLLTFDDGYDDLYDELLPLVIEHHYTPVVFLVADRIGDSNVWDQASGLRARNLLTLEQIREMQKYGVEFGSHTLTHPWLPGVSDAQLRREVTESKHRLEEMLGEEILSLAYPYGGVDRRVRSAVADAGYKLAFTTRPGLNWWNDPLCQRRAEVNDFTTALDFALKLRTGDGFVPLISKRLREMEQGLPTKVLRGAAGGLRSVGRGAFHLVSGRARGIESR